MWRARVGVDEWRMWGGVESLWSGCGSGCRWTSETTAIMFYRIRLKCTYTSTDQQISRSTVNTLTQACTYHTHSTPKSTTQHQQTIRQHAHGTGTDRSTYTVMNPEHMNIIKKEHRNTCTLTNTCTCVNTCFQECCRLCTHNLDPT